MSPDDRDVAWSNPDTVWAYNVLEAAFLGLRWHHRALLRFVLRRNERALDDAFLKILAHHQRTRADLAEIIREKGLWPADAKDRMPKAMTDREVNEMTHAARRQRLLA